MARKSTPPVWVSIFMAGLIAGIFTAIGAKYGVSPDKTDVQIFVLQQLCQLTKNSDNKIAYNCAILLPTVIILSIVVAIASAFAEAIRAGNWKIGLAIYGGGWIIGLIGMLNYLK